MMKEKINEMINHIRNAKTNDERKQIIRNEKSVLTDDELDQVRGGKLLLTSFSCTSIVECYGEVENPHTEPIDPLIHHL